MFYFLGVQREFTVPVAEDLLIRKQAKLEQQVFKYNSTPAGETQGELVGKFPLQLFLVSSRNAPPHKE